MYCTEEDIRQMLKSDLLAQLVSGDAVASPEAAQARLAEIILGAITDAGAEIDGYLAGRITVPLAVVPASISKCTKDIAVYNLVSRIGVGKDADRESNYRKRYEDVVRFLELIAKGTVTLGTQSPAKQAAGGFKVNSSRRLFSRESLKGM